MERRKFVGFAFAVVWGFFSLFVSLGSGECEENSGWRVFRSTHFVFYYRATIPKRFLYKMKRYAERYYRDIVRDLGLLRTNYWVWDERCEIYIYADREDYLRSVTGLPEWSEGGALPGQRKICCYYHTQNTHLFETVLPHEMTHLLFYEARKGMWVPHAIDEGVAMREERDKRRFLGACYVVAEALKNKKYIPVSRLLDWKTEYLKMDEETAQLFYAESCLLVDFLLTEFPKNFFANFCWRMRSGNDFYKAFRLSYPKYSAYGKINMSKLAEDFWHYVERTNPFLTPNWVAEGSLEGT